MGMLVCVCIRACVCVAVCAHGLSVFYGPESGPVSRSEQRGRGCAAGVSFPQRLSFRILNECEKTDSETAHSTPSHKEHLEKGKEK